MSVVKEPWKDFLAPFRMFGNLYFVGSMPASVHIIDTGDGLMMLDSGYQESLYMVLENMRRIRLDPADLKYLLLTHGHVDHCGGAAALKQLTGCRIFLGEKDRTYVNGVEDLSWARELGVTLIPFEPDVLLHDGDVITLGNTSVRCVATPGHTPGAMSFFFDVSDGTKVRRAALHGGMGINTMSAKFLDQHGLPRSLREDFKASMRRLMQEDVDIFLGNHAAHNHTPEKAERLKSGEKDAFVDPSEWKPYAEWCIRNLEAMIEKEST